jgi:hypothetical protein
MTNFIPNAVPEIGTGPGLWPTVGKKFSDWFDSKFVSKMAAFHMAVGPTLEPPPVRPRSRS